MTPTLGRIVLYRTDGRNGLVYDLPAIITCTAETHPGNYPDGSTNPLPVPGRDEVHLTVFTPGGFGTKVGPWPDSGPRQPDTDADFKDATQLVPGSGTYVELLVPYAFGGEAAQRGADLPHRTWRWPERV
jgi:hypothetical protein